ncbi:MAG: zinc-ribbon domain-containing protein [Marinosulfonomonas sp.]|nr:zinc-ribbon domain-containing protein [Marinosulfonomonas sp.]
MRLICPNCDAQYEVDDSVIPENGRDVQCSNCGNTWFQNAAGWEDEAAPAEDNAATEQTDELTAPPEPEMVPEPEPEIPEAPSLPETVDAAEIAPPTPPQTDHLDQDADDDEPAEIQTRGVEESVSTILREEAERETAQRGGENTGLETQPDLGLDQQISDQGPGAKDRMAHLRGLDDDLGATAAAAAVAGGQRKDLLPDIEEINSTLTASAGEAEAGSEQDLQETSQKRGFRRGFAVTILIFAAFVLVYLFAASIAQAVPGAGPALASYVDWVNSMRAAIDSLMQSAVARLTALVSQISGNRSG